MLNNLNNRKSNELWFGHWNHYQFIYLFYLFQNTHLRALKPSGGVTGVSNRRENSTNNLRQGNKYSL